MANARVREIFSVNWLEISFLLWLVSDYCMELEQGTLRGRHGNQGISDRYGDLEKN